MKCKSKNFDLGIEIIYHLEKLEFIAKHLGFFIQEVYPIYEIEYHEDNRKNNAHKNIYAPGTTFTE